MIQKEIKLAIQKKQLVTLRLVDGEILKGIPEGCTDRVKLRNDQGVLYLPLNDVKHVSRLIEFTDSANN